MSRSCEKCKYKGTCELIENARVRPDGKGRISYIFEDDKPTVGEIMNCFFGCKCDAFKDINFITVDHDGGYGTKCDINTLDKILNTDLVNRRSYCIDCTVIDGNDKIDLDIFV